MLHPELFAGLTYTQFELHARKLWAHAGDQWSGAKATRSFFFPRPYIEVERENHPC